MKPASKSTTKICFVLDKRYVKPLLVTLESIRDHGIKTNVYEIIIFQNDLDKREMSLISKLFTKDNNFTLTFMMLPPLPVGVTEFLHMREIVYHKLSIPHLLKDCDKVLYLDCDILVNSDISELFHENIQRKTLAAVKISHPNYAHYLAKMHPSIDPSKVFNTGVMIFDVKRFIKRNYRKSAWDVIDKFRNHFIAGDQDVFNIILADDVHFLADEWNVQS